MNTTTVRFPTTQFRSIPSPIGESKIGVFFTRASTIPRDLGDWREVNPREINCRSAVYRAISQTLTHEPARFHEGNRGITLVAGDLNFDHQFAAPIESASLSRNRRRVRRATSSLTANGSLSLCGRELVVTSIV
jgi:AIPR protein